MESFELISEAGSAEIIGLKENSSTSMED